MDPSALHSMGWDLQDAKISKKLIIPNLNAEPPTKEECKTFRGALDRVEKFYREGEIKQSEKMEKIKEEKDMLVKNNTRIQEQLQALKIFPHDHTRRKAFEHELTQESFRMKREIAVRERAESKLQLLFKKRDELATTMQFLRTILSQHCTSLESLPSKQDK